MADFAKWFMPWKPRKQSADGLPLGLTTADIDAVAALRSSPHWPRYVAIIERLGEQQALTLASGLEHDKYLFASGALTALRRVYVLADELLAAAQSLEDRKHDRTERNATADRKHAAGFVNTPWYDSWRADATRGPG